MGEGYGAYGVGDRRALYWSNSQRSSRHLAVVLRRPNLPRSAPGNHCGNKAVRSFHLAAPPSPISSSRLIACYSKSALGARDTTTSHCRGSEHHFPLDPSIPRRPGERRSDGPVIYLHRGLPGSSQPSVSAHGREKRLTRPGFQGVSEQSRARDKGMRLER